MSATPTAALVPKPNTNFRRAGHHSDATVVRWHPNSHLLATGSDDRTVRVWDVRDGRAARVLVGHHGAVRMRWRLELSH